MHPAALAAGEQAHLRVHPLAGEQEPAQITAQADALVAQLHPFAALADLLEDRLLLVEQHAPLIDVVDLRARAHQHLARGGGELAEHDLEQGRLAHAVAPDDAEPLARFEVQRDVTEQRAAVELHADVAQLDDAVRQFRRGRDDEVHVQFRLWRLLTGDLGVAVHAVARLGGARPRAAADPFQLALEELLPALLLAFLGDLPGGLGFEEVRVIALVREELAARQFDDAVGDAVQEISVVRDEQASAVIALWARFFPLLLRADRYVDD